MMSPGFVGIHSVLCTRLVGGGGGGDFSRAACCVGLWDGPVGSVHEEAVDRIHS